MDKTGLILFAYVFFHMLGNLQIYIPAPPGERPGRHVAPADVLRHGGKGHGGGRGRGTGGVGFAP